MAEIKTLLHYTKSGMKLLKRPSALFEETESLLMISHMRSYSTLIGHILGNHPRVFGHRERHRSYTTSKDLAAFRYHMFLESGKAGKGYAFDKLLHNHCEVSDEVLQNAKVKLFAVLRKPEATMKSVLNLGRLKGETTGFGDEGWVRDYYCGRLLRICEDVERAPLGVRYFDADEMRNNTAAILRGFERWLDLDGGLSEEYELFEDTGAQGGRGDWAGQIRTGKVVQAKKDRYKGISLKPANLEAAEKTYRACRARLLARCTPLAEEQSEVTTQRQVEGMVS
jgi:hypothetical protein